MKDIARTAGRAALATAIGLALAVGTAAPAVAGTDAFTRVKKSAYPTWSECSAVGTKYVADHPDAYDWACPREGARFQLYIIYKVG